MLTFPLIFFVILPFYVKFLTSSYSKFLTFTFYFFLHLVTTFRFNSFLFLLIVAMDCCSLHEMVISNEAHLVLKIGSIRRESITNLDGSINKDKFLSIVQNGYRKVDTIPNRLNFAIDRENCLTIVYIRLADQDDDAFENVCPMNPLEIHKLCYQCSIFIIPYIEL